MTNVPECCRNVAEFFRKFYELLTKIKINQTLTNAAGIGRISLQRTSSEPTYYSRHRITCQMWPLISEQLASLDNYKKCSSGPDLSCPSPRDRARGRVGVIGGGADYPLIGRQKRLIGSSPVVEFQSGSPGLTLVERFDIEHFSDFSAK